MSAVGERLGSHASVPTRLLVCAASLCLAGCAPRSATSSPPAATPARPTAIRFDDVTAAAGISWTRSNGAFGKKWLPETMGGGCGFIDYDNDGLLDVILINGDWWPEHPLPGSRPTLAVYHNDGSGRFHDATAELGLKISLQGMGVAVGDFDDDGWDDLLITTASGCRLFHNEPAVGSRQSAVSREAAPTRSADTRRPTPEIRRFRDVTSSSGIAGSGWCTSAAWLDYDNDGRLDLFVCHYVKWTPATDQFCGGKVKIYCPPIYYAGDTCHLFHSEGGGRFRDVTREAGLWTDRAKGLGVVAQDLDGDGKVDLIVANDQEPNFYFRNKGGGKFADISLESGIGLSPDGHPRAGMGIDVADVRNDGAPGIIIGNFAQEGVAMHRSQPGGVFGDVSRECGFQQATLPYVTFGAFWADFDNDGWVDAFITNGHVNDLIETTSPTLKYAQPNALFSNRRDGTFADVSITAGPGVTAPMVGRGAACGDFDNDGRQDVLLVPNIGAPRMLRNVTPAGHWLSLKLTGTKSNADGYGARVVVKAGAAILTRWQRGGGSYQSASDLRIHFGLGTAGRADSVEIHWPSGKVDAWADLASDHRYRMTEGKPPEMLP